jgi:hypothetical protein
VLPVIFAGCGKKDPIPPPVTSVSQSVSLVNDVDIKYDGSVSNGSGVLTITRGDGTPILTQNVSGNYSKTYSYADNAGFFEGDIKLKLKAGTAEDNKSITIPDLPATISTGSTDINAYGRADLVLVPDDKNLDQKPLTLISGKSLDDKTQSVLVGNTLSVETAKTPKAIGLYNIEVEVKNSKGGIDKGRFYKLIFFSNN